MNDIEVFFLIRKKWGSIRNESIIAIHCKEVDMQMRRSTRLITRSVENAATRAWYTNCRRLCIGWPTEMTDQTPSPDVIPLNKISDLIVGWMAAESLAGGSRPLTSRLLLHPFNNNRKKTKKNSESKSSLRKWLKWLDWNHVTKN